MISRSAGLRFLVSFFLGGAWRLGAGYPNVDEPALWHKEPG